ncbi:MAG: hypothetical protein P8X74_07410 [Reinekea sp.]
MLPKNWGEPMGAPAIFEKQIEIKLLHPASTEVFRWKLAIFYGTNASVVSQIKRLLR